MTKEDALKISKNKLNWFLKGYEIRTTSKFKPITAKNSF